MLGYLIAGAVIGPSGFGLIRDLETTRALAEFGVVFLMFAIGLELPLERIKVMSARACARPIDRRRCVNSTLCAGRAVRGVARPVK